MIRRLRSRSGASSWWPRETAKDSGQTTRASFVRASDVLPWTNLWDNGPVLRVWLDPTLLDDAPRILEALDALVAGVPSDVVGAPEVPLSGLRPAPPVGLALAAAVVALQQHAGSPVTFHNAVVHRRSGAFSIVIAFEYVEATMMAVNETIAIIDAHRRGLPLDVDERVDRVAARIRKLRPDPWIEALLREARERGVPAERLGQSAILEFGQGRHAERLDTRWPFGDAVNASLADSPVLTKALLRRTGVPVLPFALVGGARSLVHFVGAHGYPVRGSQSKEGGDRDARYRVDDGVTLLRACFAARLNQPHFVERVPTGPLRRFLVWRGDAGATVLPVTESDRQMEPKNPSLGEDARLASRAVEALGFRSAIVTIGMNTAPGSRDALVVDSVDAGSIVHDLLAANKTLRAKCAPDAVEALIRADAVGRVPVVLVTGTNGKTSTTELIGTILGHAGMVTGIKSSLGIRVAERILATGDSWAVNAAPLLLMSCPVDAVVIEAPRGGLMTRGSPVERADIGVILNVAEDHVGTEGVETLDDLARVKGLVAAAIPATGSVVLNADDRRVTAMRGRTEAKVIWVWPRDVDLPVHVEKDVAAGAAAVVVRGGTFMLLHGSKSVIVANVMDVPLTQAGRAQFTYENIMGAIGAAYALGVPPRVIGEAITVKTALHTAFPGRLNTFAVGGATVVVDYAHNPHALRRLLEFVRQLPAKRRIGILCVPGNRSDEDMIAVGAIGAGFFDRLVLRESVELRGRCRGEVAALLREGAVRTIPSVEVETRLLPEREVFRDVLGELQPGDLLVATSTVAVSDVLAELEAFASDRGKSEPCSVP